MRNLLNSNTLRSFIADHPVISSTLGVTLITLLIKIAGYAEKLVLAYYYGTGDEVDAYLVVVGVVLSIFILFRELIEPGFLRVFMDLKNNGNNRDAWRFFGGVFILLMLLSGGVSILFTGFSGGVISVIAPGFEGAKSVLTEELLTVGSLTIVFLSLTTLISITLNAFKQFAVPAGSDLVLKLGAIGGMVVLHESYGIVGAVIGLVAGALLKLVVQLLWMARYFENFGWSIKSPHMLTMSRLTLPLLLGVLFSQLSLMADNYFASFLGEGKIAALGYAKKLVEMPVVVFPYVLAMVIFPYFSELSIAREHHKLKVVLGESLKWIAVFFLPLSFFMFLESEELVQLLLERGQFDHASTLLTSAPLRWYSCGLLAFAIETVLVLFYFSTGDTRTPIMVGIAAAVLNILATYLLTHTYGHIGVAVALVVSKSLKVCLLLALLKKKFHFESNQSFSFLAKLVVASSGFLAVIWIVSKLSLFGESFMAVLFGLLVQFLAGTIVFIAIAYFLRLPLSLKSFSAKTESNLQEPE